MPSNTRCGGVGTAQFQAFVDASVQTLPRQAYRHERESGPFEVTSSTGFQHRTTFNSFDISGFKAFVELVFPGTTDLAPLFGNASSVANPITAIGYSLDQLVETFSQEVRVNAGLGEMFYLTAGAFYKDSKHLAPLFTEYYPDPDAPVPGALGGKLNVYTESWAVFGELTAVVDRLEAIAGIRYCEDARDSTNIVSQFGAPIGVVDTVDNDKVALRFVLKYSFSDDLMAYASYSDGFRSGGIQFFDLELFGIGENTFDPEELTTWEIGAKGTFGEGKLDFEFAAFLTKYRNVQVYAPNPLGLQAFNNGGRAEVEGIEVAATLNLTDDFFLRATYGLNDGKYTRPGTTHIKGDPMDGVPDYTLSLAADYSFQWWGRRRWPRSPRLLLPGRSDHQCAGIRLCRGTGDLRGHQDAECPCGLDLRELEPVRVRREPDERGAAAWGANRNAAGVRVTVAADHRSDGTDAFLRERSTAPAGMLDPGWRRSRAVEPSPAPAFDPPLAISQEA